MHVCVVRVAIHPKQKTRGAAPAFRPSSTNRAGGQYTTQVVHWNNLSSRYLRQQLANPEKTLTLKLIPGIVVRVPNKNVPLPVCPPLNVRVLAPLAAVRGVPEAGHPLGVQGLEVREVQLDFRVLVNLG